MPDLKEKLVDVHSKLMGLLQRAPYIRCEDVHRQYAVNWLMNNGVTIQEWIPASEPPEEHDSIWAKLYGTKSWQPGLFRKCSYDVLACVKKKDGGRRVISIRTYDGKWDHNKLNEETVICWQPMPQPPKGE